MAVRGSDDKARLRAELEALVNEADDSEFARLAAAVTASPDDGLDERFWGPTPDSVTAAEAVVADLTDQFAQRRELAANRCSGQHRRIARNQPTERHRQTRIAKAGRYQGRP